VDGALGEPFANTVTCALLDAGNQGRVVDDAVEYLALGRLGCAHGGCGLCRPRREGAATHLSSESAVGPCWLVGLSWLTNHGWTNSVGLLGARTIGCGRAISGCDHCLRAVS
jgi:hypothetical protein